MKPLIIGNWKMSLDYAASLRLAREYKKLPTAKAEVAFCPSFFALPAAAAEVKGSGLKVGAQDAFWESEGAYTGEVGASVLEKMGMSFVILGHSERRTLLNESSETVNRKLKAALKLTKKLTPVVCVGEDLPVRRAGKHTAFVKQQLAESLSGVKDAKRLVIAYEPIWAIGTGKTAQPRDAAEMHTVIREQLKKQFGNAGAKVRILYGGSVNGTNASALLNTLEVGGLLIGGASLKIAEMKKILNIK